MDDKIGDRDLLRRIARGPQYSSPEAYAELVRTLHAVTGILLYGFLDDGAGLRDHIIRNFIARGLTSLESIEILWQMQHYQDCYSLYRCLLDRLFHLHVLDRDGSFEQFENWSFLEQFRRANWARSHPQFKARSDTHTFTVPEKERYKALLKANVPKWVKPNPVQVAKDMGLEFLYHLGYAHASHHVHPMANDGEEDLQRITMLQKGSRCDQRSVLSNSILVQLLLTSKGLDSSSFKWRRLVYGFLDECMGFLRGGDLAYRGTFRKIASQGPDFSWKADRDAG
ncbi:MAG: DUF5677 domain-containing protein [Candidatus Bipolaricaulota bacterium]